MKSASAVTLVLVGLLVAGCPGGDSKPSVNPTVANYCKQAAEVACYDIWHCCTGMQIEDALGITISIEPKDCRRDVELLCEDGLAAVLWAARKGSVRLDEDNAQACLQSLVLEGECFQHVSEVPWERWCDGSHWIGLLDAGAECLYSFECKEGAYCAADRKCKAYPKEGQECDAYICGPDLFCDPTDGRCRPQRSSGLTCQADDWCAEGLYCEFDEEGHGTCLGLKSLGVGCKGHYQCESQFCIPGLCASGNECFEDSDCAGTCSITGYFCMSDWDCDVNETCQQRCSGQSVCAERWTVIDYCTAAVEGLLEGD